MPTLDPRVDAYVADAADFARPILGRLRAAVHAAVPDVEESIKWGFPCFSHHGMLCSMAAHRSHCSFGYWKGALVVGEEAASAGGAMGSYGRLASLGGRRACQPARSMESRRGRCRRAWAPCRPRPWATSRRRRARRAIATSWCRSAATQGSGGSLK